MSEFRSWLDIANGAHLVGWAADLAAPEQRLEVEARLIGPPGLYCKRRLASAFRRDLREAGIGDGCYGFTFGLDDLPPGCYQGTVTIAGCGLVVAEIPALVREAAPQRPVISVHVPKCAGTSLQQALIRCYSEAQVHLDYADRVLDPAAPCNLDPASWREHCARITDLGGKAVVHGHFHADKYDAVPEALRVTFLRHPIERLISHYYYWLRLKRSAHTLHNYVLDHQLDFRRFSRLPMMRFCYSRVFFRGIDPARFDFIGDHGDYAASLQALSALLGQDLAVQAENHNPQPHYDQRKRALLQDRDLVRDLAVLLADDLDFYHEACKRMPWRQSGS